MSRWELFLALAHQWTTTMWVTSYQGRAACLGFSPGLLPSLSFRSAHTNFCHIGHWPGLGGDGPESPRRGCFPSHAFSPRKKLNHRHRTMGVQDIDHDLSLHLCRQVKNNTVKLNMIIYCLLEIKQFYRTWCFYQISLLSQCHYDYVHCWCHHHQIQKRILQIITRLNVPDHWIIALKALSEKSTAILDLP